MHFRNPEILFALFFLIIPIIVHLFQLQRFKKIPFTNVALLKSIKQHSRKSERLKKLLILLSRLGVLTFLILAFAGPQRTSSTDNTRDHIYFIIDNSYSMQAKGSAGELLKNSAMNLVEKLNSENADYSLVTNDEKYENLDSKSLKEKLMTLDYSPNMFDLSNSLLKLNSKIYDSTNTSYKIILITDFQDNKEDIESVFTNVNGEVFTILQRPNAPQNFFIDSVFVKDKKVDEISLNIVLKATQVNSDVIPVSLYDERELVGKASAYFSGSDRADVLFSLPWKDVISGRISIDDGYLSFDNDFYFSISNKSQRKVLSIGTYQTALDAVFSKPEFELAQTELVNLNYSKIASQDLIVLNEIVEIPAELIPELSTALENGVDLLVIPADNNQIRSYNNLLRSLELGNISPFDEKKRFINNIHFEHPLFNGVFEKRITNFNYPYVNGYYRSNLLGFVPILSFSNGLEFATSRKIKNGNLYWISAPISAKNSDFYNSPLVVPLLYNIGKYSLNTDKIYQIVGAREQLFVKAELEKDDVLKISNEQILNIPEQRVFSDKVQIILGDQLKMQGFYDISNKDSVIDRLALNYNRKESELKYVALDKIRNNNKSLTVLDSLDQLFKELDQQHKMKALFKWFLMLSVLFLLIEILILKFFK